MASLSDQPVPPSYGVCDILKDGYVTITADVPGLKTKTKGFVKKKRVVDESHCHVDVIYGDMAVELKVEIKKGLKGGLKYHLQVEIKELKVCSIQPEGNCYEVEDDTVNIHVKK